MRDRQTIRVGGVSDSEASAVTVQPTRRSPSPQATIATPDDSARIALRKAAAVGVMQAPLAHSAGSRSDGTAPRPRPRARGRERT